jgi:hypothetical protein
MPRSRWAGRGLRPGQGVLFCGALRQGEPSGSQRVRRSAAGASPRRNPLVPLPKVAATGATGINLHQGAGQNL